MKKQILCILLAVAMVFSFAPVAIFADGPEFSGGDGTENNPYLISSLADLNSLADAVNSGSPYEGGYFKLTADIGSEDGDKFTKVIGTNGTPFSGNFDGDGHTVWLNISVKNVLAKAEKDYYTAMFGYLSSANVQNVIIRGKVYSELSVSEDCTRVLNVGGIAGSAASTMISSCISYCTVEGETSGSKYISVYVGGICGYCQNCKLVNCNSSATVNAITKKATALCAGGIVGVLCSSKAANSRANAVVSNSAITTKYSGGIVGNMTANAQVSNCYYYGTKLIGGNNETGAIAGKITDGTVELCYYDNINYKGTGIGGGNTGVTGLSTEQMMAVSGAVLSTGVADNKPLVDLLNSKVASVSSALGVGCYNWKVEAELYPETELHKHTVGSGSITFQPWPSNNSLPNKAGNYYLVEDVVLTKPWDVPSGVTYLCLNGHVITRDVKANLIKIGNGNTLNLCDCGTTEHYFKYKANEAWEYIQSPEAADKTGAITLDQITAATAEDTVVKLAGGVITGGKSATGGGGILNEGVLNLFKGNIVGNYAYGATPVGGGVYAKGTSVTSVYGGAIVGNYSDNFGGGIYSMKSIKMQGGTIAYNVAKSSGGGIRLTTVGSIFGGTAQVFNNKAGGVNDNISFSDKNAYVSLGTGASGNGVDVPVTEPNGMKIGITQETGRIFAQNADSQYQGCFVSDVDNRIIKCADNAFKFIEGYSITNNKPEASKQANNGCVKVDNGAAVGETVTLTVMPSNNYRLKADTLSAKWNEASPTNLVLTQSTTNRKEYTFTMPGGVVTVDAQFEELPPHDHSFSYEINQSNAAQIIAACTRTDLSCPLSDDPLTLTLTAPEDLEYSKQEKVVNFSEEEVSAWTEASPSNLPVIEYYLADGSTKTTAANSGANAEGKAPVNVGTYVAKATVCDVTATLEFTITPFEITSWAKLRTVISMADATPTNIVLKHDIEAVEGDTEFTVASGTDIVLDLNGHSLNAKGTFDKNRRVFVVEGKLTIEDSTDTAYNGTGTGKITGGFVLDDGGAIVVKNGGELIINSGAICNNKAANISEEGEGGGAIDCSGKLTINGGALFRNGARWGGAIGLNKGAEFLMTGGRIYENESLTMDGSAINMWNDWNKGDIKSTIIGGEIYGNISNYTTGDVDKDATKGGVASAGNAIWVEGTLYLGGTAKIYGNKQGEYNTGTGQWSNLTENANLGIVNNNEDGNARGTIKISSEHPLKNGANIWLSQTSEHLKVVPFETGADLTDYDITLDNGFTTDNAKYFHIDTENNKNGYGVALKNAKFCTIQAKTNPEIIYIPGRETTPVVETPAAITPAAITPAAIDDEILTKYSDLDVNSWYHDGILFCLNEGYMDGVGNDLFNPSGKTTRGMMMTILARVAGQTVNATGAEWYKDGLSWAVAEGLTDGTLPAGEITREQFATMLYRYAQKQGQGFVGSWMFLLKYPDASNVSSWANEAIHWCTMKGILDGYEDGTLAPQGLLTRAEAAAMIQRYCTLQ